MADIGAYYMTGLHVMLVIVAIGFFVSGLDDLFIDLCHMVRSVYRRLFVLSKYPKFTVDQMLQAREKPAAIMIPAWQESAVIGQMLSNALQTLNYTNYHIFVGTYPNDEDTGREVEKVRSRHENVHRVVCPKNGPTNKADCLNWIWQGIRLFEQEQGIEFAFFVMQDSEDVVHPLSLRLFNYLIPRRDMVQLPVFPLESGWNRWVCGHYMDEFAEFHSKNLSIRELFSKTVPSAGVGCAFGRNVLEVIAQHSNNLIFNIHSLTEDYEFGLRLRQFGLKGIFVNKAFTFEVRRITKSGDRLVRVTEHIATRERFPDRFWAAVKQKARWAVGITMQGWAELGWRGKAGSKYMLLQDRKTLVTSQINMLGYLVVLGFAALWLRAWLRPDAYRYPELVEQGTWLWRLIWVDTMFLFWRLLMRGFYVWSIYGFGQALLSIPRQVVGNFINWMAASRAVYLGLRYLCSGKLIAWDKTEHVFPSQDELRVFRRRLGDLLLEKRFISVAELEEGLRRQKDSGKPLGSVLLDMGVISEDVLVQALGQQLRVSVSQVDPDSIPLGVLKLVPKYLASQCGVIPLELRGDTLVVASSDIVPRSRVELLEKVTSRRVEVTLAARSDVSFALWRAYARLDCDKEPETYRPRIGDLLVKRNFVTRVQLQEACRRQRRSYRPLEEVLIEQGALTPARLNEALLRHPPSMNGSLGAFLVANNYVQLDQLKTALEAQERHFKPLGQILLDMQAIRKDQLQEVLDEQARN